MVKLIYTSTTQQVMETIKRKSPLYDTQAGERDCKICDIYLLCMTAATNDSLKNLSVFVIFLFM
jgi:hypothetical protein